MIRSVPSVSPGAFADLDRHLAHHRRYNAAFVKAIGEGASVKDAHAIAARLSYAVDKGVK